MGKCQNSECSNEAVRKFCSCSCAAKVNNKGVRRHGAARFCKFCGTKTSNKKYCSNRCQADDKWQQRKKQLDQVETLPGNSWGHSKVAKKYLIEVRGQCCEICGTSEWLDQPIPLVLDHIDGNPRNWAKSNLQLLCGNCNSLTPTFAGRNKKNPNGGRPRRMQRYKTGQSY